MLTKNLTGDGEKYFSYAKQIAWRSGPKRWSIVQPVEKVAKFNKENPDVIASATTNQHIRTVREYLVSEGYKVIDVPYLTTK